MIPSGSARISTLRGNDDAWCTARWNKCTDRRHLLNASFKHSAAPFAFRRGVCAATRPGETHPGCRSPQAQRLMRPVHRSLPLPHRIARPSETLLRVAGERALVRSEYHLLGLHFPRCRLYFHRALPEGLLAIESLARPRSAPRARQTVAPSLRTRESPFAQGAEGALSLLRGDSFNRAKSRYGSLPEGWCNSSRPFRDTATQLAGLHFSTDDLQPGRHWDRTE